MEINSHRRIEKEKHRPSSILPKKKRKKGVVRTTIISSSIHYQLTFTNKFIPRSKHSYLNKKDPNHRFDPSKKDSKDDNRRPSPVHPVTVHHIETRTKRNRITASSSPPSLCHFFSSTYIYIYKIAHAHAKTFPSVHLSSVYNTSLNKHDLLVRQRDYVSLHLGEMWSVLIHMHGNPGRRGCRRGPADRSFCSCKTRRRERETWLVRSRMCARSPSKSIAATRFMGKHRIRIGRAGFSLSSFFPFPFFLSSPLPSSSFSPASLFPPQRC